MVRKNKLNQFSSEGCLSGVKLKWGKRALKQSEGRLPARTVGEDNPGLASFYLREKLVKRLYEKGISDPVVLRAMQTVERHKFVDSALASQAYEDTALPIGYGQTISQPFVVAKTISVVRRFLKISEKIESNKNIKVLEIGFGSGYQASVLSNCFQKVVAVERIFPLFQKGLEACNALVLEGKLNVVFGDGKDGLKSEAPFDAIFFSAALDFFPSVLREQLNEGGVIIAPTGSTTQHLLVGVKEKGCEKSLLIYKLDAVSYVPVKRGVER